VGMLSLTAWNTISLPQNDSAALIEVDFPVSAGPLHTTTGHPENSCDKIVIITLYKEWLRLFLKSTPCTISACLV
jgi:hypothetical protein